MKKIINSLVGPAAEESGMDFLFGAGMMIVMGAALLMVSFF